MYYVDDKSSEHGWEKENLVTITDSSGHYDSVVCKYCGIKGRKYNLNYTTISEVYNQNKAFHCPNVPDQEIPNRIKITFCTAQGAQFANALPNSEHDTIPTPEGEKKDNKGVWIMGVGEPIKILNNEYVKAK